MWILLKLILLIAGYVLRLWARSFKKVSGNEVVIDGVRVKIMRQVSKGVVKSTHVWTELQVPCVFKLTTEKWHDRLFKALGFSTEIQTGDAKFDNSVYIACDHAEFARLLRGNKVIREQIMQLFTSNLKAIVGNGKTLHIEYKGDVLDSESDAVLVVGLAKSLVKIKSGSSFKIFSDPFARRALIVEAFVWSLAGYAIGGVIEWIFRPQDIHLNQTALLKHGLLFGGSIGLMLLIGVTLLLGGSSRGHRILVESFTVVLLGFPFAGLLLVSDLNMYFDQSASTYVTVKVKNVEKKMHSGRRGHSYTYYLHFENPSHPEFSIPETLKVNQTIFSTISANQSIQLVLRKGRLGHPWIESINGFQD